MQPSQFEFGTEGRRDVLTIFPGALGDFLCCLPALLALRRGASGRFTIVGRDAWLPLVEDGPFETRSIESRAVSELYGGGSEASARSLLAGFVEIHSWTGYGHPSFGERLRSLSTARVVKVHPFRAFEPEEHATDYYARCLGVPPAKGEVFLDEAEFEWAKAWLAEHNPERRPALLIHAGSGSRVKNWPGFGTVAAWWRRRGGFVAEVVGPAERECTRLPEVDATVEETVRRLAALLSLASAYAGNDSGVTHLAATVGAAGLALLSNDAVRHWRPRSTRMRVIVAQNGCRLCAEKACLHNLPVPQVLSLLSSLWSGEGGEGLILQQGQRWQAGQ